MTLCCVKKAVLGELRCFRDDLRGSLSVELVFVLPLLLWAYVAIVVFNDAYRARMEGQSAALSVADTISRNTNELTVDYLEGMNDVFDFLTTRNRETRLRISSIMWDADTDQPAVVWSYGTRGLPSLLDLIPAGDSGSTGLAGLGVMADDAEGAEESAFDALENQLAVANLVDRIPPVLPGEALILVESFSFWESPLTSLMGLNILNSQRLAPLAVTRPRFSPFIRFELDNEIFPEGPPETLPTVGEPEAPVEPEEEEPEPEIPAVDVVFTEFDNGETQNWSSNTVSNVGGNNFLGPFGRETRTNPVRYNVNLGGASKSARIEFDLLIIDSWDGYDVTTYAPPEGEHLMILVNGYSIDVQAFHVNLPRNMAQPRHSVSPRIEGRFTTRMELIQSGRNLWGAHWNDQIWRVTIDVENPAQIFSLGFAANLSEPLNNEAFGFLNFRITAKRGAHDPDVFVPEPANLFDGYTIFQINRGCPDHRLPAQTHALRVQDLNGEFRHRVRARGERPLSGCPGFNNTHHGVVHATPNIVLNYDRQNNTANNTRLRIRTDDRNRGRSCNSNLLVRNPFGAYSYHRDIASGPPASQVDYNAMISMGLAETGQYHIWVLSERLGACDVDLVIENH